MPTQGVEIEIHFPDGHGLKAEDTVRFRGIEVGTVHQVELNHELDGVDVTVNLKPFAETIARDGSQFWIVRPQLGLGEISGLETAVGHKYIGVLPGDENAAGKTKFAGMADSPADATNSPGAEIILRGEHRFGVTVGSPLSHRGFVVGRVLAVELSQDGRTVDSRVRVFEPYQHLVTSETKFWSNSGLEFDLKWNSGVHVDVDSLETVVKGGVAMLTIANGGQPLKPGQLFEIIGTPDKDWYQQSNNVSVAKSDYLRGAITLDSSWKQKGVLYGTKELSSSFVATHIRKGDADFLRVPTDAITPPAKAIEGSFAISGPDGKGLKVDLESLSSTNPDSPTLDLEFSAVTDRPFTDNQRRQAEQPEKCMAIRGIRSSATGSKMTFLHLPIEAGDIGEDWVLKNFDGDKNVWHGAPVVAEADGKLIGTLIVNDRTAKIVVGE